MSEDKNLKSQRDRFLAFAFASADLFVETTPDGQVDYALGAVKGMTGFDVSGLIGRNWLALFSKLDRPTLVALRSRARPAQRCGPLLVTLDDELGEGRKALLTGIKMPGSERFYLTLGFTSVLLARAGEIMRMTEDRDLLDKNAFLLAAQEALDMARSLGQNVDLTLLDIADAPEIRRSMGEKAWEGLRDAIGGLLRSRSTDGHAAAEISEGRYSIVHDKDIDSSVLRDAIASIAREKSPDTELEIKSRTVTADLKSLNERDAAKALVYTINEFERKGAELNIETLNNGFKAYVSANAQKIGQFKSIVKQLDFDMHFQPIVDLNKGYEAVHYEMLSRFHDKGSTLEWVTFGEDIGMAAEFDIAVCERAINYLIYKSGGRRTKFAINLSGQSMQSDKFFDELHTKLKKNKILADRLLFEITESTQIENLEKTNNFIRTLQEEGFKVCLDDFGAGAASFQYLQGLHVNYLKIDGQYTRRILVSGRDEAMIRNLISMCRDLKIKTIAEMVETEEQAYRLKHLGADYGQGFLFGPPTPKPDYEPPRKLPA